MTKHPSPPAVSMPPLPFGMAWDRPAFTRVCNLANFMFEGLGASINLVRDGRVWRSSDPAGRMTSTDPASELVIATGQPLWIEDSASHPLGRDYPMVSGPPYLRFYVGAPIILSDGSVLGALCVVGLQTKPRDERLLARLEELAAIVADECERARGDEALRLGGRELKETRNVLAALVEVAPVSILMVDADLRIVQVSSVWCEHIGTAQDQVVGRFLYDVHPAFRGYDDSYQRVLGGETIRGGQVKWVEPNGDVRWLRTELVPWHNQAGEVSGLMSIALDITETVEALRRSERSEERMNLAATLAQLHVWEMDFVKQELIVAGAPEANQTLFGRELTYADLAATTSVTIHPDDRPALEEDWHNAVINDLPYVAEYRTNRYDDKEVWAACSVRVVRGRNGMPSRIIGAMQNITDRKRAELDLRQAKDDAEAATRAKSAFLATMSHEIRTPLNGVLGMAQAMEAEELSAEQRERLSTIRQSGETLLAILNDVLDLSKIEAGKLELEAAEFDIEHIAAGAHAAFSAVAEGKGLGFSLVVEPEARGVYLGDSTRLRQVIYNLVSNALKFTERGQVRVTVGRGDDLLITVEDSGIGVTPDRVERLFDTFEQADASTTRRYGGTGLGLAICRQLAELMGGRISCRSEVGYGSVFEVALPIPRIGDPAATAPSAAAHVRWERTEGDLRVLAAEDNKVNQLVLKTLLQQAGIDVVMVENGQAALDAWRTDTWDLILMDVQMPVMDGPTATEAIRAEEASTGRRRTPIVALTANAMAHQVAEYAGAGMDDFVAKPIQTELLFAAIERVLERRELAA